MALEIQPNRSKWFYARLDINGKKIYQNLRIKIEGNPPQSMRQQGDVAFERSRLRAMVKYDELAAKLTVSAHTAELH